MTRCDSEADSNSLDRRRTFGWPCSRGQVCFDALKTNVVFGFFVSAPLARPLACLHAPRFDSLRGVYFLLPVIARATARSNLQYYEEIASPFGARNDMNMR